MAEILFEELNIDLSFNYGTDGSKGDKGDKGNDGANGKGVPSGGLVGQVLSKKSSADFDTEWVDQTGGGGGIEQVQSDWNEQNAESKAFIKNKPTIPTPTPQVQSDWNEIQTDSPSYIKNKPTIPSQPTKVSELQNDSGYTTKAYVDGLVGNIATRLSTI